MHLILYDDAIIVTDLHISHTLWFRVHVSEHKLSCLLLAKKKIKRAKSMALQQQKETSQLRQARFRDLSTHNAVFLQEETPEKRQERLQNLSEHQAVCLQEKTPEMRQEKFQNVSIHRSIFLKLETQDERQKSLSKESQSRKRFV